MCYLCVNDDIVMRAYGLDFLSTSVAFVRPHSHFQSTNYFRTPAFPFPVHKLFSCADLWFPEQHRRACGARQRCKRVRGPQVPGGVSVLARVPLQLEALHTILHDIAVWFRCVFTLCQRRGGDIVYAHR